MQSDRKFRLFQRIRASIISLILSIGTGFIALINALKQTGLPVDKIPGVLSFNNGVGWR